mmetsp:Transcript_74603/g.129427  ORF Transcript_74603/g.129427 Transcript_74603/m.129427 type:complete len:133 (+) Transcript_74603:405-803(+)
MHGFWEGSAFCCTSRIVGSAQNSFFGVCLIGAWNCCRSMPFFSPIGKHGHFYRSSWKAADDAWVRHVQAMVPILEATPAEPAEPDEPDEPDAVDAAEAVAETQPDQGEDGSDDASAPLEEGIAETQLDPGEE